MTYRPEVDGLRAVAVLPVMLFHAGLAGALPGGFAGVDVFFVISGYLITGLLLQDLSSGRFSLALFYERRARRLLPALLAMLLLTLPVAWVVLVPPELKAHAGVLLATLAFGSNVVLWLQSGYFDTAAELKPLLHTWSLGVEEQFYLFFPLLLWGLWRWARRGLFAAVLLATLASLGAAHWAAVHKPAAAYFLLPTRAWELGLGALVALSLARRSAATPGWAAAGWVQQTGSCMGLVAVLASFVLVSKHTPWPGLAALLPCLGTAAVLAFGHGGTWVARLLSHRILVGVGLVSYSAYLWHQPLLALARAKQLGAAAPGLMAAMLLLTLGLAWASWRWVERPFRTPGLVSRSQLVAWCLGGTGVVAAAAAMLWFSQGAPSRMPMAPEVAAQFDAKAQHARLAACYSAAQLHSKPQPWCGFGPETGAPRFLVLGDSHARAMFPAFDAAATQAGMRGGFVGSSACPPLLGIHARLRQADGVDCHALNAHVLAQAQAHGIGRVYLLGRWSAYADAAAQARESLPLGLQAGQLAARAQMQAVFRHGLDATVAAYRQANIEVVVVPQVPEQLGEPLHVYHRLHAMAQEQRSPRLQQASPSRERHEALQAWVNAEFARRQAAGGLQVLSFDAQLCEATHCPVGDVKLPYYSDDNHLSAAGASRLVPRLAQDLQRPR